MIFFLFCQTYPDKTRNIIRAIGYLHIGLQGRKVEQYSMLWSCCYPPAARLHTRKQQEQSDLPPGTGTLQPAVYSFHQPGPRPTVPEQGKQTRSGDGSKVQPRVQRIRQHHSNDIGSVLSHSIGWRLDQRTPQMSTGTTTAELKTSTPPTHLKKGGKA